ncbi:hypothetical protein GGP41_001754 [Bipolaris sorokiniana]|uniref:Uncharacterized protein n=1 Tax=Cochliobolus sativus TaxID=45130 RepID=A0A8H6DZC3_COCSA|nr:hypothetical protein GGP41_001754 [Bipolaris sorokiniana]
MLPSESSTKKPRISGQTLAENNILFYSKVHDPHKLRRWVQPIRQLLIRRRTKIPCNIRYKLKHELENFHDLDENEYKIMTNTESFDSSVDRWDLQPNDEDFETAPPLMNLFGRADTVNLVVLKELKSCFDISQNEFWDIWRETWLTRESNMQLRWERHQETHWTEFKQSSPSGFRDGKSTLTYPVPDFTYGFPIIDTTDPIYTPYLTQRLTENFSLPTLHKLREAGVLSSPRKTLAQWNSSKPTRDQMRSLDLMCFPWAVVEVKSAAVDVSTERMCYCQAANASAAALSLREKLLLASKKNEPNPEALVIFSFTCVGTHVKLWLTYRPTKKKVVMRCIWATSLEISWGVFVLRMVLKNMHEWVNREVRPELSRWIEGARGCPKPRFFLSPDGDLVEQNKRAASQEPPSKPPTDSPVLRKSYSSQKDAAQYSQQTSRIIRSGAPSPTFSNFQSAFRGRVETNGVGCDNDDGRNDSGKDEEASEDSPDEGYYSSPKKNTKKKATPTLLCKHKHDISCKCGKKGCLIIDNEDLANGLSSLSLSDRKR